MVYRRWISIHDFRWTPILTFTRRHLRLLDWLEENVDLVAFKYEPERIGLAIGSNDLRLTIQRTGMTIEAGIGAPSFEELLPTLGGIFQHLEPKATVLTISNVISTFELDDVDYDVSRKVFATAMAGAPEEVAGMKATDGSALMDLESEAQSAQVEWGIVEASELLERFNNPRMSRIQRSSLIGEVRTENASHVAGGIPAVAVYVELLVTQLVGGEVTDPSGVGDIIGKVEDMAKSVTLDSAERFTSVTESSAKEGATW